MKKTLVLSAMAASAAFLLAGCAGTTSNEGFAAPFPAGCIYTQLSAPTFVQQKAPASYTVVRRGITTSATMEAYFGLVAEGDASYATLKKNALSMAPGADDLIDIEVSYSQRNIVGINKVTVVLTGTAIKYK